jgi:hypothetical protein
METYSHFKIKKFLEKFASKMTILAAGDIPAAETSPIHTAFQGLRLPRQSPAIASWMSLT